ncbi:Gll0911 protein [Hydrogenimonas sp.]|nr:Gll0911 protein [Hydrogenimonas sp.]
MGEVWSVNIGRNGVGKRKEGDGKTPSGLYSLNEVYGYETVDTPMPFYLSKEETLCIDDAASRYYNRIVNSSQILKDYRSFEYMRRKDGLYEIVVTVGYNQQNERGRGSCIFLHIADGERATAGCVAMKREQIEELVEWLDPKKRPVIVIE